MVLTTLYFQMNQPFRLHPDRGQFIWTDKNKEIFEKVANEKYLPTLDILLDSVDKFPEFKFSLGMSGSFLEQAEQYKPEVIEKLKLLLDKGNIELLDETYYNSFAGLFADPEKKEHRAQVSKQRTKVRDLFGVDPTTFRFTSRMFNSSVAKVVEDMGLTAMIADLPGDGNDNIYKMGDVMVIPRDIRLSHYVSRDLFASAKEYVDIIANSHCTIAALGYSIERIGVDQLRGFWRALPYELSANKGIELVTPKEVKKDSEQLDLPSYSTETWQSVEGASRDTNGLIRTKAALDLVRTIESIEEKSRNIGGDIWENWRHLSSADNLRYIDDKQDVFEENPYGDSGTASYVLTQKIADLENKVNRSFEIISKPKKRAILMVTPEIGSLSARMGEQASFVYSQTGGQGVMISALIEGILDMKEAGQIDKNWEIDISTLNLVRKFQLQSGMHTSDYIKQNYMKERGHLDLVTFHGSYKYDGAYDGNYEDLIKTSAQFQNHVAQTMKRLAQESEGRVIVHTHDQMAGGYLNAKATVRGLPNLHTSHNIHSLKVPMYLFTAISDELREKFFLDHEGKVDTQATAIKSSWIWNTVSKQWMEDVVYSHFPDIPSAQSVEAYAKHNFGNSAYILNAISPQIYPENISFLNSSKKQYETPELVTPFGPTDNEDYSSLLHAKKSNLLAWQKEVGLREDKNAVLALYCARGDKWQKSIDWVYEKASYLVEEFRRRGIPLQISVLANPVGRDEDERNEIDGKLKEMALNSYGSITYHRYSHALEALGSAAASIGFGPSRFEPCGQNDMVSILNGAFFVATNTGGYHDKIEELRLRRIHKATQDHGNGFLHVYTKDAFWNTMVRGVDTIYRLKKKPHEYGRNVNRIMKEARQNWSIEKMVLGYMELYDKLFSHIK